MAQVLTALALLLVPGCAAPQRAVAKQPVVAILVFDGVELLDFAGPAEVFSVCAGENDAKLYDVRTVGLTKSTVTSMDSFRLNPELTHADAPDAAIVVIPGGNVLATMANEAMLSWLRGQADRGAVMFSVCNGASVLARAGLIEGHSVATHHENAELLRLLEPSACVRTDCRFVHQGNTLTAGGVSAGIDAALYLVQQMHGVEVARRAATLMEYEHWSGFGDRDALLQRGAGEAVARPGRIYEPRPWAVMALLAKIRDQGVNNALADYPAMLASAAGHDREMIEEAGLDETAWWLLTNARDSRVPLDVFRFIAAAYPQSTRASARLADALEFAQRHSQSGKSGVKP